MLQRRGDRVVALTREPASADLPPGVDVVLFDVNDPACDPSALDDLDAVVHLAGETVDGRWTPEKKLRIADSRIAGTRNLVAALARVDRRPRVLISASASGYYGDRGDEVLDEESLPGHDFLAAVCVGWEREAQGAARLGMRVACLRTGVVFGPGGALRKMAGIFRWGAGGPLGSGRQWMPWIHLDDLAALYCFVIDREDLSGPIAAVAPDVATNARVMQGVGHALGRPALAPAPAFALELVLGEFGKTLLGGQLVVPKRATSAGFVWQHPALEAALIDVLAPGSLKVPAPHAFVSAQLVRAPLKKVFAFFSDPANLERLTPPALHLRMTSAKGQMGAGSTIDYALRVWGLRLRWRALIVEWKPEARFVDVQVRGPYLWWRHVHEFEEEGGGVMIRDRIDYVLPFAPLGDVALHAVRGDIENAFAFRRRALEEIFA